MMANRRTKAHDELIVLAGMGMNLLHLAGNFSDSIKSEKVIELLTEAKKLSPAGQVAAAALLYSNATSIPDDSLAEVKSFIFDALDHAKRNVGDIRDSLFAAIARGAADMWDLDYQRAYAQLGNSNPRTDFIGDLLFAGALAATEVLPLGTRLILFSPAIERLRELDTDIPSSLVKAKGVLDDWTRGLVPASAGQDVAAPTTPSSPAL